MKTKLVILFLLLLPIVDLFFACCPCDVTTKHVKYSHKTLSLKNLDNSGENAIESEASELNKNAYGIRLYLAREKNTIAQNIKQINSIFIQSAYATSCECPPEYIFSASDSIISIKIFTLNNFDNQHFENSDITDYFRIAHTYSSVKDHLTSIHYTYEYDIQELTEKTLEIDLLLMIAPEINSNHQFKIQIALSDGRVLEQQTREVKLL